MVRTFQRRSAPSAKRALPAGQAEALSFTRAGAIAGARRTLPLVVPDLAIGAAFGVAARQVGLGQFDALLMSALVFAGTSQFIALGLWLSPLPVLTIILTTFIVNSRHLLMGASLRPWLAKLSAPKAYASLFLMTDETWALTMQEFAAGRRDAAFLLGCGLTLVAPWLSGTLLGYWAGAGLSASAQTELTFIPIALMASLLPGMWRANSDALPWLTAAVVASITALLIPGKWYILVGGLAGSLVGALRNDAA